MNEIRKKKQVAIIGSAFNPPHLGHKDVLEQVAWEFDEIVLVPSFRHAFGKQMVEYKHRLKMAGLLSMAFILEKQNQFCPPVLVSDIERSIGANNKNPVYTYQVLEELENRYRNSDDPAELTFVLGPDNTSPDIWKKFYKAEEIRKKWRLRAVSERLPVRSSQIRQLIENFKRPLPLLESRLKAFTVLSVADYIHDNKLYS